MLPAETQACASDGRSACGLTWLTATRIDESFLRRSATSTESFISTTSVAATRVQRAQPSAACERVGAADEDELGRGMRGEEGAARRQA